MPKDNRGPKERAYDDLIYNHMTEIIEVCKQHNISLVCMFELDKPDDDPDNPLLCTSAVLQEDACDDMARMYLIAKPKKKRKPFAVGIALDKDGNVLDITNFMEDTEDGDDVRNNNSRNPADSDD